MYPYIFQDAARILVSHETFYAFMIASTPNKITAHVMLLCLSLKSIAATHISSYYDHIYHKSYHHYVTYIRS